MPLPAGSLTLTPPGTVGSTTEGWIENTCGYGTVELVGKVITVHSQSMRQTQTALQHVGPNHLGLRLSNQVTAHPSGELTYSGQITNAGCGAFLVSLPSDTADHNHLECPHGDAGWEMGPTTCYTKHETVMTLADAATFCAGLAPGAVVAKVMGLCIALHATNTDRPLI